MAIPLTLVDANKLWDEFLSVWPLDRLQSMSLSEYTQAGSKDSFTYWIESRLEHLGSIWGGSAFKFGVFSRAPKSAKDKPWNAEYDEHYGWINKYGKNADEAFQQVRNLVAQTATAARNGDLQTIEKIDLGTAYKWKIAFLYQNRQNPTVLPIFKRQALSLFLDLGRSSHNPMGQLNAQAMLKKPKDDDVIQFGAQIWEKWESSFIVWKVSHNATDFTKDELDQLLSEHTIAVRDDVHNKTSEKFHQGIKTGDLFFLCHGDGVQLLGRISSNAEPYTKKDGWSCRKYTVVKLATKSDPFDKGSERLAGWMPGADWQFVRVPIASMGNFERKILEPYFGIGLEELDDMSQGSLETDYLDITLTQGAIDNGYLHFSLDKSIFPKDSYGGESGDGNRGKNVVIVASSGDEYPTDIRVTGNTGRVRARFGTYFKSIKAEQGDIIRVVPADERRYLLKHIRGQATGADMSTAEQSISSTQEPAASTAIHGPLNRILYGPPGTGKTFRTAEMAVAICDGAVPSTPKALRKRYEELRRDNRISFVTFHQSYSYEEFVEGIRPESHDGHVTYDVRPGIFRQVCEAARRSSLVEPGLSGRPLKERTIYKMSLGTAGTSEGNQILEECIEKGYVLLGWGEDVDFTECKSTEDIHKKIKEDAPDIEKPDSQAGFIKMFKDELQTGDIIVASQGNSAFRAIAEVTGEYEFLDAEAAGGFHQMRRVRWLAAFETNHPVDEIFDHRFVQRTLHKLAPSSVKFDALEKLLARQQESQKQPFVLIIDEINRANISKVFGELITLLESDKREGADNALTVKLPYSGKDFSVPLNLFLIGTMNTADRSIALIDTALRRRFDFEELRPNSDALDGMVVAGIDLAAMLDALNDRIEYLYDRDHTIGHAYLMGVNSLAALDAIFRRKIIPLLQEYFYEDWSKLCLALNDNKGVYFIEMEETTLKGLQSGDEGYEPKTRYTVRKSPFQTEAFLNIYK